MRLLKYGLLLVCLSGISTLGFAESGLRNFISVSDIHFDPFATCPKVSLTACPLAEKLQAAPFAEWDQIFAEDPHAKPPMMLEDSDVALLQSAFQQLTVVAKEVHPRFILYLGDTQGHHYREKYVYFTHDQSDEGFAKFTEKALKYTVQGLHNALPEYDIYPVVGNNDGITGDYNVVPAGRYLHFAAKAWSAGLHDPVSIATFYQGYANDGYYALTLKQEPRLRLVFLNTVLFSARAQTHEVQLAAERQLQWLHQELQSAKDHHQRVLIAFHIPLGVDILRSITSTPMQDLQSFWTPEAEQAFRHEMHTYYDIIAGILPGHIHMDVFQIFTENPVEKIPVSFTPAISPIFGNHPGFKVFYYDTREYQLRDVVTYDLPIQEGLGWQKEYAFAEYIGDHHKMNGAVLSDLILEKSDHLLDFYRRYHSLGSPDFNMAKNKEWAPYYWCNYYDLNLTAFGRCLEENQEVSLRL